VGLRKAVNGNPVSDFRAGITVDSQRHTHRLGTRLVGVVHAHYDGKHSPIADFPIADSIAYSRVDADTLAYTVKKDGTVFETGTIVVSASRETRTVWATGTNANGQNVNDVRVFDRQ
jgi:hypothetical protein